MTMLIEGDTPVIQKLNGIHERGTAALRAGAVEPFSGYSREPRNRFITALRYSPASQGLIREIVVDDTVLEGKRAGIDFFVAGRTAPNGYPLHTTLLEGLYQGGDEHQRSILFGEYVLGDYALPDYVVGSGTTLAMLRDSYVYFPIQFDAVVVDKGPVLLAATKIPTEILQIRDELAELYTRVGLKALSLDNLLHLTLARMINPVGSLDDRNGRERVNRYIETMEAIHKRVSKNPLTLYVAGIYTGSSYRVLTGQA